MSAAPTDAALRAVAAQFEIPQKSMRFTPIAGGHINVTFRIDATRADGGVESFVLQRIRRAIFGDPARLMENIDRVTAHLARKPAGSAGRALELIRSRAGDCWVADAAGDGWRVYRFVEGSVTRLVAASPADAALAGAAFGRFQWLLADLPPPPLHETIPGFHDTPARLRAFRESLRSDAAGRAAGVAGECDAMLQHAALADAIETPRRAGRLAEQTVHNDAKLSNLLFDAAANVLCVIDLDTVMPGLCLHDFGDMVRSLTCAAGEDEADAERVVADPDRFAALAEGYLSTAGPLLRPDDRSLLVTAGLVIVYEQALRFMTDYLAGDRYYRVARPGHNLDRARNQFALLGSLLAQQADLEKIAAAAGRR